MSKQDVPNVPNVPGFPSLPTLLASLVSALCVLAGPVRAAEPARTLEEPPQYGVYYQSYEPTFYTGFAPRIADPRRLHLEIGRGNQLRVTAVLDEAVLDGYARELVARQRTYRTLVDQKRIVLTQNRALEAFEKRLQAEGVEAMVAAERAMRADRIRQRNLELLERLNPGRVFEIHLDIEDLMEAWKPQLRPEDGVKMTPARRVELIELMLPTRIDVLEVTPAMATALDTLVRRALDERHHESYESRDMFRALLADASRGVYRVDGGDQDFFEFTALYPVGTLNDTVPVKDKAGKRIPLYPTTGRRALVVHQRTRVVDHIPNDLSYSYSPWLPYIHIGTRMHDALHTLFWKMKPAETSFLPAAWRDQKDPEGKTYEYLWLLSRGPMSHGCTHVNVGHQAELRQMLPAEEEKLGEVDLFLDRSEDYDVFDIDGNGTPEVMGVRYWIAFSLGKGDKPQSLRVRNERCQYYDWLYAGDLACRAEGSSRFASIRAGAFDGRKAVAGREYRDIALYEGAYEPEKVQFYRAVDIPFARELRRVGASRPFPGCEAALPGPR
jgi:hypothetical protein